MVLLVLSSVIGQFADQVSNQLVSVISTDNLKLVSCQKKKVIVLVCVGIWAALVCVFSSLLVSVAGTADLYYIVCVASLVNLHDS